MNDFLIKVQIKSMLLMNDFKNKIYKKQKGLGTIEVVLITVVLVLLVTMFKGKAMQLVDKYLKKIDPGF